MRRLRDWRRGREAAAGSAPARPEGGRALRRALLYLRPYRREMGGALLAALLVSAANLGAPQLIRVVIDTGIPSGQTRVILQAVAGMVAIALLRAGLTFFQGYLAECASQGLAHDLREALFVKIQRLSFSFYDRTQTGQLLTRATSDVEQVRAFAGGGLIQVFSAGLMLAGSAALLLTLNWRLTLLALATTPLAFVMLGRVTGHMRRLSGEAQRRLGRLNAVFHEQLSGLRLIRAHAREQDEGARYAAANAELLEQHLSGGRAFADNFPFIIFFANLGTLAVVWYGGLEAMTGRLSVGELVAFNTYLGLLIFPILSIGSISVTLAQSGASATRVFEVLDAPSEIEDAPGARPLARVGGRVEFEGVRFRYPGGGPEILRGVSFTVEAGQTVAVVGATGSGKSTVVNLLPRFYDVTGGRVLIDGQDVRDVTLASLRGQIGVVLQETLLFSGTVRDNITFGRPDASPREVERAARAARADAFIEALPQGYETVIGERGVGLSGGQRQRLAIARALLVDPRLLILDDSTSAMDFETEAALRETLAGLAGDRRHTTFVIAHRLSTVRDADLILVLDGGRVVASGTHEELLRENPLYHEIVGAQLTDDGREPAAALAAV